MVISLPIQAFSSIVPWVFGYSCFVRDVHPQLSLDPKFLKCVFLGYSWVQKSFCCYSPTLKRYLVSMSLSYPSHPLMTRHRKTICWYIRLLGLFRILLLNQLDLPLFMFFPGVLSLLLHVLCQYLRRKIKCRMMMILVLLLTFPLLSKRLTSMYISYFIICCF